jgi:hypothetical protein
MKKLVKASIVTSACCLAFNTPIASAIIITKTNDVELLANTLIVPNTGITLVDFSLTGSIFEPREDAYVFNNHSHVNDKEELAANTKASNSQDKQNSIGSDESSEKLDDSNAEEEADVASNSLTEEGVESETPLEQSQPTDTFDEIATPNNGNSSVSSISYSTTPSGAYTQTGVFSESSGIFGLPNTSGVAFRAGGFGVVSTANETTSESTTTATTVTTETTSTSSTNEAQSIVTGETTRVDSVQADLTFDANEDVYGISFVGVSVNDNSNTTPIDSVSVIINGQRVEGITETPPVDNPILPNDEDTPSVVRFDIPVEPGSVGNRLTIVVESQSNNEESPETILLSSAEVAGLGETEFTPVLPDPNNPTNEDGDFVIVLPEVEAFETIFIDPEIATGYTFTVESNDPNNPDPVLFASVTAPSPAIVNDPDGFILEYSVVDGTTGEVTEVSRVLAPSEFFTFPVPVETFSITGIDPSLGLDPNQSGLFVTGVGFDSNAPADTLSVIQSPIIQFIADHTDVSEPDSLALIALSMFGILVYRRKTLRK